MTAVHTLLPESRALPHEIVDGALKRFHALVELPQFVVAV
jgi:hypothetical protein